MIRGLGGTVASVFAIAVVSLGLLLPGQVIGSATPVLDQRIQDLAAADPSRRVEALVSLRAVGTADDVLTLLGGADEIVALYHGWQGLDSDYVGGYEFVGGGASHATELAAYRASYESMLRETISNIELSMRNSSPVEATAWERALRDAKNRLAAFLREGLPVIGARVTSSARVLADLSASAAGDIRLIEPTERGASVSLPWR